MSKKLVPHLNMGCRVGRGPYHKVYDDNLYNNYALYYPTRPSYVERAITDIPKYIYDDGFSLSFELLDEIILPVRQMSAKFAPTYLCLPPNGDPKCQRRARAGPDGTTLYSPHDCKLKCCIGDRVYLPLRNHYTCLDKVLSVDL